MLQAIINAIHNREVLLFTYSGISRTVQPVAVGVSRAGNEVLRCYQIAGGHASSGHQWDLCELSKISNLHTNDQHFEGEPLGYKRGDKGMTTIYAEL